uniref:Uncharacterized protein n=1 Tax=Oryza sativa subsp. japonica TaxID=39947 RepID=Q654I5_ORYSJ|nr:hypothetical protein [Oryza sativa Japonica Group]
MAAQLLDLNLEPPIDWDAIGDWVGPAHELEYDMVLMPPEMEVLPPKMEAKEMPPPEIEVLLLEMEVLPPDSFCF